MRTRTNGVGSGSPAAARGVAGPGSTTVNPAPMATTSATRNKTGRQRRQFLYGDPRHFGDLEVLVAELSAGEPHQIVVHGLMHPTAIGDEPVVDAPQCGQHAAANPGLLGDLTNSSLFGRLTLLNVALGQRPQHSSAPIDAADQSRDLRVARPVDTVDNQAAGRCFMHGAQALRSAAWRAGSARLLRCRVWGGLAVRVVLGRTGRATTAAPAPAPTWFGSFAV